MSKTITKWKVADLKPHPRQAPNFPDLPVAQLRDLADDIRRNGLRVALEILPDGTIVCGHQRFRAVTLLGWEEVDVWINHELAAQGDAAVEQRLIEDNLNRRQLDRLEMARAYRRLQELADQLPAEQRHRYQFGRLRDVLGQRFGISGRTLDRLVRILDTPPEVQEAFRRGALPLILAGKTAGLDHESKEKVAVEIRNGGNAKKVLEEHLLRAGAARTPVQHAFHEFIRALQRGQLALENHVPEIATLEKWQIDVLKQVQPLIRSVLQQAQSGKRRQSGK